MNNYSEILKKEALKNNKIFWDVDKDKLRDISDLAITERILNYGDIDQFRNIAKYREPFTKAYKEIREKKRCNLSPMVINYVDLYLKNNA